MKRLLLLFMTICVSIYSHAQATDLVVDCQTPGWLSSKINYGDQMTVQNLKVTGYINSDDFNFIGTLIQMNLNGVLDLGDVSVVGDTWDGKMGLPRVEREDAPSLRKLIVPKSLKSLTGWQYSWELMTDTVVFDAGNVKFQNLFQSGGIKHLIIGESVKIIYSCRPNHMYFKSVHLPSSLTRLEKAAFWDTLYDLSSSNISEFPNLEYIGSLAFVNKDVSDYTLTNKETLPDTIRLPKIKEYYIKAFHYKEGMHIFFGDQLTNVYPEWSLSSWNPALENVTFHIAAVTPPSTGYIECGKSFNVYVPKEAVEAYKAHDQWKRANILAEPKPLEQIELTEHEIAIDVDEQHQLTANPIPSNADDITMIWSSDNEQVATVSEAGLVTAFKKGVANITVSSADGTIKDICKVTVKTHAESVSLQSSSINMEKIGDTYQLEATVLPENTFDKTVTWKSANEQICTVSDNGLVTATGIGSTLVTVTTMDGGLTATCVVKVLQHVDGVSLNKTSLNMKVGEGEYLQATVTPSNADNKKVTWLSSDNQIVTVSDEGYIAALKAGEATVTATSDDNSNAKATCKVIVTQPVTGIELAESTCLLHGIGESKQLTATVLPKDATNKSVKWSSSNEGVCIVSNGKVIATGYGIAVVIATTEDGGFSDNCTVTVESVTGIEDIDAEMRIDATFYTPDGKVISKPQSGINIMRMSDGTMRKVMIK